MITKSNDGVEVEFEKYTDETKTHFFGIILKEPLNEGIVDGIIGSRLKFESSLFNLKGMFIKSYCEAMISIENRDVSE